MDGNAGAGHGLRYDVNLSILFPDLDPRARPDAARAAGFDAVEFWWPFDGAVPGDREVTALTRAIGDAGLSVAAMNLFGGDLAAGERGLVSHPHRRREFTENLDVAIGLADRLGCRRLNALYGNRIDGVHPETQDELALSNLDLAADAAAGIGARLLLEPLSGIEDYPLRTAADVLAVVDRLGRPEVTLLADLYHLAVNGDDLSAVIARHAGRIGHVQLADAPGRGRPGSGTLDLEGSVAALEAAGYRGWAGLEYLPDEGDPFDWLPRERRSRG